jgi:HlyD family secretion protein
VSGRLRLADEVPQGMRQNQRVSTRIILERRDDVLKVARGPFLDSGGGRLAYVLDGDIAVRRKIRTGSTSVAEVEILEGLAVGDRIVVSNLGELERVERVRLD